MNQLSALLGESHPVMLCLCFRGKNRILVVSLHRTGLRIPPPPPRSSSEAIPMDTVAGLSE